MLRYLTAILTTLLITAGLFTAAYYYYLNPDTPTLPQKGPKPVVHNDASRIALDQLRQKLADLNPEASGQEIAGLKAALEQKEAEAVRLAELQRQAEAQRLAELQRQKAAETQRIAELEAKLKRESDLQQQALLQQIAELKKQQADSQQQDEQKRAGEVFRDRLKDGSSGPEMVWIPEGRFKMGDIQGGSDSDEKPVHWVSVKKFAMGRYEITFAQYDKFATATGREKPSDSGLGRGNRPVMNVSWLDVTAYAKWLSQQTGQQYRLPTEAQWEYAARAGTKTKYWWGNTASHEYANYGVDDCCDGLAKGKDRWKYTSPVGSFAANPFGLYDTAGNVWEWTCSEYENRYNGKEMECLSNNRANDDSLFVLRGSRLVDRRCHVVAFVEPRQVSAV